MSTADALKANHFDRPVEKQDSLPYMGPPFCCYSTRQSLGQAPVKAGRFAEAEALYRNDPEDYPRNGWSMSGLADALQQQGKMDEAKEAKAAFAIIWAKADVKINGSRL
tara:strand:+ start:3694 stop:4020 length:327 start_codon:yes stop_codon:yes gene_type:complete